MNIAQNLRYVFVADPGWKLCQIDGEQAEARDVGFFCGCLFDDWSYLDAVEKYDLHTYVTKQVWPTELPWTGDWAKDKKLASETIFYRDFDYRFLAKRGAHLSNYMGTAWTASRSLKMPLKLLEEFQAKYILGREEQRGKDGSVLPAIQAAFPCIPKWWQWTAEQLQTRHFLVNPFGRKRHFFGRIGDDATLREAIANLPQSTTADRMSLGMWRVWRYMPEVQLLGEGYDSVIFQYKDQGRRYEDDIINRALKLCEVPLIAPSGRRYVCPGEAKIGWNWGPAVQQSDIDSAVKKGKKAPRLNLEGMIRWSPKRADSRERQTGLKRIMAS